MAKTKKKNNQEIVKAHVSSLKVGDQAPYFEGKGQAGNKVRLTDFKGKNLILYFYPKDNTHACTSTACSLRDAYTDLDTKKFMIVGVSADSEKSHAKFALKQALPFSLIADVEKTIIKRYDVWGTKMLFGRIYDGIVRTTFIIDAEGYIKDIIHTVDTKNHAQQILSL